MAKKIIIITLIILIAVFVPVFWAAKAAGFNISAFLSQMPVTRMFFKPPPQEEEPIIPVSPLEKENQELRSKVTELERKIADLEGEKTRILQEFAQYQQELVSLREYKEKSENFIVNTQQLASYYKEMKPEALAEIMDNMDDYSVLLILPLLDKEQSGKILDLMDPRRAAMLSQTLLGTVNPPALEDFE